MKGARVEKPEKRRSTIGPVRIRNLIYAAARIDATRIQLVKPGNFARLGPAAVVRADANDALVKLGFRWEAVIVGADVYLVKQGVRA